MSNKKSFLALGENVNPEKYIIAEFYLETEEDFLEAAEAIAGESSIGTWTKLSTMTDEIHKTLAPKILKAKPVERDGNIKTNEGYITIAYPLALWEEGNVPQLLSAVAGNVFGMKALINLRLLDIQMPYVYRHAFQGPALGIKGVRDIVNIYDRPLIGTIVKPKCGLPTKDHAKTAYNAWVGGCDIVKDDENLTDQDFNPFKARIKQTLELKQKAEKETGRKKIYVANITAQADVMLDRAKYVKDQGGKCIMIDIITAGFSGVQFIRKQELGLIIHGHRAMHAAFTSNPLHGISMLAIAKAARLSGVDQLHTGTVIGKMEGTKESVTKINDVMRTSWGNIKTTLPIASGGLHPGHTPTLMKILGKDFIINYGGGIHGHPDGTLEGAKAAYQSVQAALQGTSLLEYAKDPRHKALARAIEEWGVYEGQSKKSSTNNNFTYNYDLLKDITV